MPIEFPKILKPIHLSEYAAEMGEAVVWVWVNLPRDEITRQGEMIRASDDPGLHAWYATVWSQHADPGTHLTVADIEQLNSIDTDPRFLSWLMTRTRDLIQEHHFGAKKN
jgi:hypothetical protein